MLSFQRKLALGIGIVALGVATLAGMGTSYVVRDKAEDSFVSQTVEDVQRLLRHDAFSPSGVQATHHVHAAALALVAAQFDIVQFYTAGGLLMAEQFNALGRQLQGEFPTDANRNYTHPWYERRWLPGRRPLLRLFVPVRDENQALLAYVEGARLVPAWQIERLDADAQRAGLLAALAVLLCGAALYPLALRLNAGTVQRQRELLESHISMMEALGRAIARCDGDSGVHNYRVAWVSATLAEAIGLHGRRMQELIVGAFLHDVGKIGIPDQILLKPGPLTEEELRIMRTHVGLGEDIVSGAAGWLGGGEAVVAHHHEKWDGSGYPRGLARTDIPLVARIFAIADVFDALCSHRPYRAPLPLARVLQTLEEGAGSHFDPHLVQVFEGLAHRVYTTLAELPEPELRRQLEAMVRKHFRL